MTPKRITAIVAAILVAAASLYLWPEKPEHPTGSQAQPAPARVPAFSASMAPSVETAPADRATDARADSRIPVASASARRNIGDLERERWRAEYDRIYEDIGRDLQLDAIQVDNLLELLVDHRVRWAESAPGYSVEETAALQEFRAGLQRETESQIGAENARKLADYQRSIQVRYEVEELRRLLERDLPLSERQRKELIQRAIERHAYAEPIVFTGAESEIALTQEMQARNAIAAQRMLDAARNVLTAEQFARLETRVKLDQESTDQYIRLLEEKQRRR